MLKTPQISKVGTMKTNLLPRLGLALVIVAGVGLVPAQDEKPANTVAVEVPAAVKTTLQKEAEGGRIVELGRVNEDGRQQYEATVSHKGLEYRVRINLRGIVLRVELKDYNDAEDQSLAQLRSARLVQEAGTRRQRLSDSFEARLDGRRYAISTDEQGRPLKKELQQDDNEGK